MTPAASATTNPASLGREHPRYAVWQLTRAEWLLAANRRAEAIVEVAAARTPIEASFAADSAEVARLRELQTATAGR